MFDQYTLKARFYPVIILFFPLVVAGVFYSFEFKTAAHFLSSLGLVGALTYLFSQLGRDRGKQKEPALWQSWGGVPSVQLLRLTDSRINKHTKEKYHQKLQGACPVPIAPTLTMEANNLPEADEVYQAWTKHLIGQTRDTKKFSLLFKENISYGFRRNLWGVKPIALFMIGLSLVTNYIFWYIRLRSFNPLIFPDSFWYSSAALFALLLFWIFIVKKAWVKIPALAYAERLCEAAEQI
ncbi:MAG TPA: hypothetical protein VG738_19200 [Chitinophagaceae bacterium]|nr:hypothetical protein [Chitinophagaceae bacterium]